ncbi:hypothetical protein [Asticcacaulis sp. AC402]|uniref:hypothetical protein n=1 Tax=Asticcacaulis sp. AC402 TaxID=1282361 RepID=UPI0003C3EB8E|nr:hypothetical protein [Asticcacaulis sp. AC402]ESQ75512.1 hypothetical protein ABAC402_08280 [Asticcacaulis sp. AC402]
MRLFAIPLFASLGLALVQCSPQSGEESKPTSLRSTVELKLTPAAVAKLKATGETAVLDALYFGIVTQETASMADPKDGTIHLGTDLYDLPPKASQTVRLTAKSVDPAKFDLISQGRPILRVAAYASKDGQRVETLSCHDYQDYVDVVQKQAVTLRCDLSQQ